MKARNKSALENQENVAPLQSAPKSTPSQSTAATDSPQNAPYYEPGSNDCVESNELASHNSSPEFTSGSAYREISWSAMFNHFLDSRQLPAKGEIDKCSITYLGESFPLALVLEDLKDGGKTRLHHPGPPLRCNTPETTSQRPHPTHLLEEDMICLRRKRAFDYPDQATYEALVRQFVAQRTASLTKNLSVLILCNNLSFLLHHTP